MKARLLTLVVLVVSLGFILTSGVAAQGDGGAMAAPSRTSVTQSLHSSSVMFIENVGQWNDDARFQVWGGPGTIWLAGDSIWLTLLEPSQAQSGAFQPLPTPTPSNTPTQEPRAGVNLKLS